jgi:hypothetical protein
MSQPFTTPESAAPDIDVLLRHLRQSHSAAYLYRGQVQHYESPLLPSQFRRELHVKSIFTRESPEFEYSLRRRGNVFHGNYANDTETYATSVSMETLTHQDRDRIRQHLFDCFGYALGAVLAQQYGFKSEMLDATTDLNVAAFFATYPPTGREGCGVIYVFEGSEVTFDPSQINQYDFYSCPDSLVFTPIIQQFERNCSAAESLQSIRQYYEIFRATGERCPEVLRFPVGSATASRIGKQRAAVIAPDFLLRTHPQFSGHPLFGTLTVTGEHYASLLAVEDLASRKGVRAFFFRHTAGDLTYCEAARNFWPNDTDFLLDVVAFSVSDAFSYFPRSRSNPKNQARFLDAGWGDPVRVEDISRRLRLFSDGIDEYEFSAKCLPIIDQRGGHQWGNRLDYLIKKGASLCRVGFLKRDENILHTALRLINDALKMDAESLVLLALKHIVQTTLGENIKGRWTLFRAYRQSTREGFALIEGIAFVDDIVARLVNANLDSSFVKFVDDLYETI